MSIWLEILIVTTIAGSVVVASKLLFRLLSHHNFTARWHYLTSKTALLFYLLPVVFVIRRLPLPSSEVITSTESLITGHGLLRIPQQSYLSAEVGWSLFMIWALGVAVVAGWYIYCYSKFRQTIKRTSFPIPHHHDITELVTAYQRKLGISGPVKLASNRLISSPVLVGLFKPKILLPHNMKDLDLGMVIHHELIHLKRKDLWVKLFVLVASALHWFNPFVHLLRRDIHVWSELSCDEEVVKDMSHAERKRYGETILNLLLNSTEMPAAFSASLSESGVQLKRRLGRLLNVRRSSRIATNMAFAALCAIGGLGITAATWSAVYIPSMEVRVILDQTSADTQPIGTEVEAIWATETTISIESMEGDTGRSGNLEALDYVIWKLDPDDANIRIEHPEVRAAP